ncbi:putative Histidine kinase [Planktothrix serta PCC 8927]|uniref:histidine kinase n=1 Tax=Planktothrix serta PCC 8927 TaxID=671068 RepID=A0A7Z9C1B7_9CYAN|nr:PAS domain S-box protein [Planktothrix serta]VXD25210.1 putative Histidine kinase [Planktothrix serta PCC 8927]
MTISDVVSPFPHPRYQVIYPSTWDTRWQINQLLGVIHDLILIMDCEHQEIQVLPTQALSYLNDQFNWVEFILQQLQKQDQSSESISIIQEVLASQACRQIIYQCNYDQKDYHFLVEIYPLSTTVVIAVGKDLSPCLAVQGVLQTPSQKLDSPTSNPRLQVTQECLRKQLEERQQIEIQLQTRKTELEILMNNAGDCIVRIDQKLRYLYANHQVALILGIPQQQLLGKTNRELGLPPSICQQWDLHSQQVLDTGQPQQFQFDWETGQGWRSFQTSIVPELQYQGKVKTLLATTRDITQQKRALAELQQQNQFLKLLTEITLKIRQSLQLNLILKTTVDEVQKVLNVDRVIMLKLHPQRGGTVVQEAVLPQWLSLLSQTIYIPELHQHLSNSSIPDQVISFADLDQTSLNYGYLELMEYFQVKASLIVPIWLGKEDIDPIIGEPNYPELGDNSPNNQPKLWGFLMAHQCAETRQWTTLEINFLKQLADQVGIALKQAQLIAELKQAHQCLSCHFENSPLAVIEWDQQLRIKRWSSQAERMFGWTSAEILGQQWSTFQGVFATDMLQVTQQMIHLIDGTQTHQIIEAQNRTQDGRVIDCEWYNSVVRDEDGSLVSLLSLAQNVSDRKQAEQGLVQSEERFRTIFEQAAVGFALVDISGKLLRVNQRYCEITGYSEEKLVGQTIHDLIYSEDLESKNWLEKLQSEGLGETFSFEKRYIRPNGQVNWVQIFVSPLNELWKKKNYILLALEDIQERKQTEEALRKSEERWQLALQGNNDGIWDWNIQSNEVFFSPRWKEMLGYEEQETCEHLTQWKKRVHPDDLPGVMKVIREHLDQKIPFYITEHRVRCKDGSYKWILDRGQALWDEGGNLIRMVGSYTDISDRKRAEQEVKQTRNFLKTIIDHLPVAVFVKSGKPDEFGVIKLWNKTCEMLFGFTAQESVGRCIDQDFPPEQANFFEQKDRAAFAQRFPEDILEEEVDSQSLGKRLLHTLKIPLYDEQDNPEFLICISEDITERKRAEVALKESEARYSSLTNDVLDKSAVGIFILDANFHIVWINQALENFFGIQREVVIGQDKQKLIKSQIKYLFEDAEGFAQKVLATYQNNQYIEHFECHILPTETRKERWLEHISQPIYSGLYAGGRIEHYTDITERKRAEEELHRVNRALRTISECNQALVRATTETELLNNICQILINVGNYHFAWVGYPELTPEKRIIPVAKAGFEAGYLENLTITWDESEWGQGPSGTAVKTGEVCVFQNIHTNSHYAPWKEQAQKRGYTSSISLPLIITSEDHDHDLEAESTAMISELLIPISFGVLNLYATQTNAFDEAEVKLLKELVDDIVYGIMVLRIRASHAETEKKFRQLAENIHDVFWITNAQGNQFLYVSPAYQQIWERNPTLLYENFPAFINTIHPEDQPRVLQALQSPDGAGFDIEYRILRPDGSCRWIWDRGFPIVNESGQLDRRGGIAKDITHRKQTEQLLRHNNEELELRVVQRTAELETANERLQYELMKRHRTEFKLRKSEEQYRTLVQNFPNGAVFLFDPDFRYTIADGMGLVAKGLSRYMLEGKTIRKALPSSLLVIVEPLYQSALAGETTISEVEYDGRIYYHQALPVRNEQGEVLAGMVVMQDITEQKQSQANLREAERRWRSLLENVRLLVVGLDRQGKVEYVNPFFLEVTGYTQTEVLGKNWLDNFKPNPPQRPISPAFSQLLDYYFKPYDQQLILTKSGEDKIIAWNNTLLKNLQGDAIGMMSIGEDITERYAIERMKDEFISVVSHELRTPLTSIHGGLNLLSTGLVEPQSERGKHVMKIAAESAERLVRLVNDILELERLESGKICLTKQVVNSADLLQRATEQMQVMANRTGINLEVCSQSLEFYADPDRVLQVLTNLLSNAIKFSDSGDTIKLSVKEEPGEKVGKNRAILFKIQDQGRGIPPDKIERIFERFHQVDASDSRKKGGTGLGLAICRSIVEQHGGRIWVQSKLDQGSCFYFTLPMDIPVEINHDP